MEHWLKMRMGVEPVDDGSDDEPPFRPSKAAEPASAILAAARAKAKASVVAPFPPGAGDGAGEAATRARSIGYPAASHVPSQACRRSLDQRFLAGEALGATRARAEADAPDDQYEDNYYDGTYQV